MNKFIEFLKECRNELLYHVSWPKFDELQSNTVTVLVASLLLAVVIAVVDITINAGLKFVYDLFQ
jgi:preprotein translocase subunit SecE